MMKPMVEKGGICELIEPLINRELWIIEFIEEDLKEAISNLKDVCLLNEALSVLLSDGIKLGDVEDTELKEKLIVAVLGGIKEGSYEEYSKSFANFMRKVFGVGIVKEGTRDIITSPKEMIEYVKIHSIDEIEIKKAGWGAIGEICYLIESAKSLCRYITSKLGSKDDICKDLSLRGPSREEAAEIIKKALPSRGDKELKTLNEMFSKMRKALAILSIGSNKYLTSAYTVRFIPLRVLSEYVSKCGDITEESKLCNTVKEIIDFLGLKIFDLRKSGGDRYREVDELSYDELMSNYLVTIYETYVTKYPWKGGGTQCFEGKPGIFSFIYWLKRHVSECEKLIFGDSIINKISREYIVRNVRELSKLISDDQRKLLTEIIKHKTPYSKGSGEIGFGTPEGKFFKVDEIKKILLMYPLVTIGLYDVSIGLNVVYVGEHYYWHEFIHFYCLDRVVPPYISCNDVLKEVGMLEEQ